MVWLTNKQVPIPLTGMAGLKAAPGFEIVTICFSLHLNPLSRVNYFECITLYKGTCRGVIYV